MSVEWGEKGQYIALRVEDLLDGYVKELDTEVDRIAADVASETAKRLRKQSPRGHGKKHYADGWGRKKLGKGDYIVHNKTKPGLTYLLNNGHAKSNGQGEVPGDHHIDDVNEWAEARFMKKVKEKL